MNKKNLLGLILFASIIIGGMFFTTELLINHNNRIGEDTKLTKEIQDKKTKGKTTVQPTKAAKDKNQIEHALAGFASDTSEKSNDSKLDQDTDLKEDSRAASAQTVEAPQLIYDSSKVDYKDYIPKMQYDNELKEALDVVNPHIKIDAKEAILFDADTKQVIYQKKAVKAAFPASTLKLLTSIVALHWCSEDEKVTIGDEITMIAPDSTRAFLKEGQVLTIRNLLEAMLLPSGNDAAYAVAAYVGRKSLNDPSASKEKAVAEFVSLMNEQAKELGAKNSCFKTPDGYDAVGQYTTAYDMGLIGMAAADNDTILEVTGKSSSRNIFISGEDVTWDNTNKLISRYSGEFYSPAIGLKTGTSTMAGRCLISAASQDGKKVVCVIMDSTSVGRWEDAITLLKYGLKHE